MSPAADLTKFFLRNVEDALENGYDTVCAHCGCGSDADEDEELAHDHWCPTLTPEYKAERSREADAFAERIAGIVGKGDGVA